MKKNGMKNVACRSVILATLFISFGMAHAALPPIGTVTDDTALYQNLSEIRVKRQREFNYDQDLSRLSLLETRYRENLPGISENRIEGARQRLEGSQYRGTPPAANSKRLNVKIIPKT